MQRWIAAGVVAMMLLCGGGWLAYRSYKQNRPQPIWVPMAINPELPEAKRDVIIKQLKEKLGERALLVKVSQDVGLMKKWKVKTDDEGARQIAEIMFVRMGEADTPQGKVPSINIGVTGKSKDTAISGEIAMRLMEDVWKILGISPRKPSEP